MNAKKKGAQKDAPKVAVAVKDGLKVKEKQTPVTSLSYLTDEFFYIVRFALEHADWDESSMPKVEETLQTLNKLEQDVRKAPVMATVKVKLPDNLSDAVKKAIEAGSPVMPGEMKDTLDAGLAVAQSIGPSVSAESFARARGVEIIEESPDEPDGFNAAAALDNLGYERGADALTGMLPPPKL